MKGKKKKPPFIKPEIKEVLLIPEEVYLANCKSANGTNRAAGRCQELASCANKAVGS